MTFKMPCLSAYTFFSDGTVKNDRLKNKLKPTIKGNTTYYMVFQDNEKWGYITPPEIIAYGKHLMSLETPYIGVLPKIIIYRPVIKVPSRALFK